MAATSSFLKIATFKKFKCLKIKPDKYRGIFRRRGIEDTNPPPEIFGQIPTLDVQKRSKTEKIRKKEEFATFLPLHR